MNISIVITLDARYQKKDGSSAVILRVGRDNRTLPIPTGFSIPKKYWDDDKREVKKTYEGVTSVTRLNKEIYAELTAAKDILLSLHESKQLETMSLMDIKKRLVESKAGSSFFTYADSVIADFRKAKKVGTADAYKDAVKALENFHGSRNLNFKEITFEYLKKFETDHFSKGNGKNGLAAYLRGIRAIYNKGIKSGRVDEKFYPFKKYTIGTAPTEKRAIGKSFLEKIILLDLSQDDSLFHARNYFVCSYMLYGMNFYDMAFLKPEHLVNGRVVYQRSKTSKQYDIKVTPAIEKIISHYLARTDSKEYIFPILKRDTIELQSKDIKWARKRYNSKLGEIAKVCGIEKRLTSYVSRHSFATQAMLSEIPLNAISAMLGHSSIKTTEIYLQGLPSNILDDYNSKLALL